MPFQHEDGVLLDVRGEIWKLARTERFEACAILTLEGRDRSNHGERLRVIDPFDRPRLVASRKLRKRTRHHTITSAFAAISSARQSAGLWTAADSSIETMRANATRR